MRAAIASGRCATRPAYFANPLQLYLCLTNLRGLPYVIEMVTAGGVRGHRVTCHADFAHFAVLDAGAGEAEPLPAGVQHPVNWPGTAGNLRLDGWGCLRDAALATSAFPGGLPARAFSNLPAFYQATPWCAPAGSALEAPSPVINLDVACTPERSYEFWCVDGELINNEPVEFARMALAGGRDVHNARDPRQCDRAVLMIDPLPDDEGRVDPGMGAAPDMVDALFSMFSTLRRPGPVQSAGGDAGDARGRAQPLPGFRRCARRRGARRRTLPRSGCGALPASSMRSSACMTSSSTGATARSSCATTSSSMSTTPSSPPGWRGRRRRDGT